MSRNGRYLMANGVNTYYEVHGEGDPLLLMHGGTDTIECFQEQTPALAKRFRVVLPERRAVGLTDAVAKAAAGALEDPVEIGRRLRARQGAKAGLVIFLDQLEELGRQVGVNVAGQPLHRGARRDRAQPRRR